MKLILILLEIYAGGLAFLLLLSFCVNLLENEGKFGVEIKLMIWFSILWPVLVLVPLFWIYEYLREKRELIQPVLEEKSRQNEEMINPEQPHREPLWTDILKS
jgi:H+/gluconate symporter-like permease